MHFPELSAKGHGAYGHIDLPSKTSMNAQTDLGKETLATLLGVCEDVVGLGFSL
jgi:hypothetical protein